jgi:hypothetical protein
MKYTVSATAVVVLMAALMMAEVSVGQTSFANRAPQSTALCDWRPHPRSHEKHPLSFVRVEARRSLWLMTALPHCGFVPLAGLASRWSRLLISMVVDPTSS